MVGKAKKFTDAVFNWGGKSGKHVDEVVEKRGSSVGNMIQERNPIIMLISRKIT